MIRRLIAAAPLLLAVAAIPTAAGSHPGWERSCRTTPGEASCSALLRIDGKTGAGSTTITGYGPAQLQAAYNLTAASSASGTTQTVAVVDAYNDPYAASDLAVYRQQFGLPPCTVASGCFRKVSQTGSTLRLPNNNGGWAEEESLDIDMVSAICPNCHILLVEGNSASFANLGAAENEAVRLGATEISNSYGGSDASDAFYGSYYNHPGVAITASSGDGGYGVEYPASSGYVTAVGGTSLTQNASTARGWTETAWSGAGSGCSSFNARPAWQASANTGCANRAVADVSADADPYTGVAVYDSYSYQGYGGWLQFGGTSVASPIIASVYALAGNANTVRYGSQPYANESSLYDVTSGSNGTCTPAQLCTSGTGWDGPTGLGTPDGTGAF